jgi:hypothetical protein
MQLLVAVRGISGHAGLDPEVVTQLLGASRRTDALGALPPESATCSA